MGHTGAHEMQQWRGCSQARGGSTHLHAVPTQVALQLVAKVDVGQLGVLLVSAGGKWRYIVNSGSSGAVGKTTPGRLRSWVDVETGGNHAGRPPSRGQHHAVVGPTCPSALGQRRTALGSEAAQQQGSTAARPHSRAAAQQRGSTAGACRILVPKVALQELLTQPLRLGAQGRKAVRDGADDDHPARWSRATG